MSQESVGPTLAASAAALDLSLVLDSMPGGVCVIDRSGRNTLVNRAAATMLGHEPETLVGRDLHEAVHHSRPGGAAYPREDCTILRAAAEGREYASDTELFWRRDGTSFPAEVRCQPLYEQGSLVGALVIFRDISERRREEERARQLGREQFARARAELQQGQLREVLAQAPALICVTRGPRHTVDMVNERFRSLIGDRQIVGLTAAEAFPEAQGERLALLDRVFETGEPIVGEEIAGQVAGPAGPEERFFNVVYQPLREEPGLVYGIMIHAVDVTEQVRARRALEERTAELEQATGRLRRAAEIDRLGAAIGLALTRAGDLPDVLDECARAVVEYLGGALARIWTLDEAVQVLQLQAAVGTVTHLDDPHDRVPVDGTEIGLIARERRPYLTNRAIEDERVVDREWARREGLVAFAGYPLMVGDRLVGVLAVFARRELSAQDVQALATVSHGIALGIQRKRSEEELRYQRDLVATITDNAGSALFMMDTAGFPVFMNAAAREMTGYASLDEIRDRPLHDAVHFRKPDGSPYPMEECPIDRANAEIRPLRNQAEMFCRKDGTLFPVRYNVAPVEKDGVRLGAVIDVRDVTRELEAELALRQRAEQLARLAVALDRSNRELDAFAYAASHDLRAPLRGIANLAQWIEEDLQDQLKGETREMLALMRSRMHRMEALIEGLLQYSRAGRVHASPERVDTRQLVLEVIDLLNPPEEARITLGGDLPALETERLPLQQVFQNLLANALKHAGRMDPEIAVAAVDAGEFVEFSVRDNGPGIPPEYHDRIWGIFQTLQPRDEVEGAGIGLSLVKKLVEAQGGRAWVESTPGEGATFRFLWRREPRREDA